MSPCEATFIYLGMTKEKWPHLTPQTIRQFIDEPRWLDEMENDEFVECFHKYFDWYWRNQK
jgi:hypothetical protein